MQKASVFGVIVLILAYSVGAVSDRHDIFPWPQIFALKDRLIPKAVPESRYALDQTGRLIADERKSAVACPEQTGRTAVLLVLGQSNAANYAGQRYESKFGAQVLNFFGGQCFVASSPLLGSTGSKGEYWTQLGNLLIESGHIDQVIVAPLAYSGSEVARWARGGDINPIMVEIGAELKRLGYSVTEVLWDQGEIDYVKGTSSEAYRERMLSMIDTLRQQDITAPVYVSIASKCLESSNAGFKTHIPDNAIVRAQLALSTGEDNIRRGVNTDVLLNDVDRYDDCHIGGSGAGKVARAWADLLLAGRASAQLVPTRAR